ncbi:hypothetical protein [Myceligenerans cantabricum]
MATDPRAPTSHNPVRAVPWCIAAPLVIVDRSYHNQTFARKQSKGDANRPGWQDIDRPWAAKYRIMARGYHIPVSCGTMARMNPRSTQRLAIIIR